MLWFAPPEIDTDTSMLEEFLWDAADQCRANSGLSALENSGKRPPGPVRSAHA